ncbi:plasmid pRiA4b ORF-3 family protein [Bradyrhizobium septentrionale]|nr:MULTISPECIES: plasmid pRiA4b ORF-3 family protein [Bradyrhizobium]MCK7667242.1 plasmid pRiA4b ORF-3 family protein [Bradyrhizobium sp. 2S1]UGY20624.1 plasmid pRiA4b ORF-3 family protein [Bradyrhizobium septentrionale]UGY29639.1 plasmid pRiA4b ORF-3 family protein [Bradyrhizobium septentrionale]
MRRLVVPLTLRLDRLHLTLQAAFGWTDSHLFEFHAGEGRWGIPDPDGDFGPQRIDARKARLCEIVRETGAKTIHYLYDFGDSWDHVIKLEKWFDNTTTEGLPLLLEAAGGCPPEDVGGAPGYPNTPMPSVTPPIRSTNKCASGARSGSIPTSSTGRRLRPPSTHCPEFGSHAGKSCDQNRASRANQKGRRATLTIDHRAHDQERPDPGRAELGPCPRVAFRVEAGFRPISSAVISPPGDLVLAPGTMHVEENKEIDRAFRRYS